MSKAALFDQKGRLRLRHKFTLLFFFFFFFKKKKRVLIKKRKVWPFSAKTAFQINLKSISEFCWGLQVGDSSVTTATHSVPEKQERQTDKMLPSDTALQPRI